MNREAFEKWAATEFDNIRRDGSSYESMMVAGAYIGWQAWQKYARSGEQLARAEGFCDSNCTWLDHHKDCKVLPFVWMRSEDAARTMIASEGERAEVAPGREDGFDVPLYTAPPAAINQQLLEALEYYAEYFDGSVGNKARAAIEAAKETPPAAQVNQQLPEGYVLTPTEPTEAMIDAGVAVAFAASVHGKGGWNNYMNALYRAFIAAAQEQKV